MQGNGGTVSSSIVSDEAVKTVMSGPASGVMAAAYTSMQCGFSHVVTYDMGGTSCDVGLIADGIPKLLQNLRSNTPCQFMCLWLMYIPSEQEGAAWHG